jgi:hypothetical protein
MPAEGRGRRDKIGRRRCASQHGGDMRRNLRSDSSTALRPKVRSLRTLAFIGVTLVCLATNALAQLPGAGRYVPVRLGTVIVKNETPTPVWIEFLAGCNHLLLKASYCLMPQNSKSNETWTSPGVHPSEERFQVRAQIRPHGCSAQNTSRSLDTPAVKTASYATSWKPPHNSTITRNDHQVFIEGHNMFTYAIRVVTR